MNIWTRDEDDEEEEEEKTVNPVFQPLLLNADTNTKTRIK